MEMPRLRDEISPRESQVLPWLWRNSSGLSKKRTNHRHHFPAGRTPASGRPSAPLGDALRHSLLAAPPTHAPA
jgi:hypothetical protein